MFFRKSARSKIIEFSSEIQKIGQEFSSGQEVEFSSSHTNKETVWRLKATRQSKATS